MSKVQNSISSSKFHRPVFPRPSNALKSIFGIDDSVHNLTALDLQYWTHHLTIIKERQEIHVCVEQDGEPAGWHFEGQRLNPVDVVRVVADYPRHARLSDLVQLSQGERPSLVDAKVVEELVSFLQPGKLVANDTLEHWTKD